MRRATAKRKPYPSTISDEEWGFVAPYLTLCREDARQRHYASRDVCNAKRRKGSKVHIAVDTLGHLLALRVTAADEQERAQVGALAADVQAGTGETVTLAYVAQGYTGETAATAAAEHGIALEVVKLPEAKRGFVLLPRRWVIERTFAWTDRFRRLARDYERLPTTLAGLHFIAVATLMLQRVTSIFISSSHPLAPSP